jgi:hypothetical protein
MPTFLEVTFLEPDPALVRTSRPRAAIHHDVVATPVSKSARTRGALYEKSGALIRRSQRSYRAATTRDPDFYVPSEEIETVPGHGHYIGTMIPQYGHFITEGISACWVFNQFDADYFVAHPFVSGQGEEIPAFAQDALRRIGIPPERIRIIRNEMRFESLVVPERLWHLTGSVNRRFDAILDRITAGFQDAPELRLYLSRSEFKSDRSVRNERDIEELFRRAGFVIVHPQHHRLAAQLELYGRATVLAGLAGSALHNVVFCPKGAAVISIGDRRATVMRNQLVCGALAGGVTVAIPFTRSWRGFHIRTLARDLAAVLERLDVPRRAPASPIPAATGATHGD